MPRERKASTNQRIPPLGLAGSGLVGAEVGEGEDFEGFEALGLSPEAARVAEAEAERQTRAAQEARINFRWGQPQLALVKRAAAAPFSHGAIHQAGNIRLYDSYHCSRYNTNTRVLTPAMFQSVFARVRADLG